MCTSIPDKSSYIGGVANIVKQYDDNKDMFVKNGIHINVLNLLNELSMFPEKHIDLLVQSGKNILKINKYLIKNNVDIIHFHTSVRLILVKDLFIISKIRKNKNEKIIVSIHFADIDKILTKRKGIRTYCINRLGKHVDEIIFLSEQTKQDFEKILAFKKRCNLLYTFQNLRVPYIQVEEKIRDAINKMTTSFIFVGSIDKRKGIIDLLRACMTIDRSDFVLHICGKIRDKSLETDFFKLVNQLGGKVVYHGYVSGVEKEKIFLDADVLVLPSYGEGMPVVIMEAMRCGQAMIISPVGAIPEIITDEQNALWVQPGDTDGIANAMITLMDNKEEIARMAWNNLRTSECYSIEKNIEYLCKIYGKLIEK